jgi:hypothetical protein
MDGGEWSASHTGIFTPRKSTSGTHRTVGWVVPKPVWMLGRRKISYPARNRTLAVQPIAILTKLRTLTFQDQIIIVVKQIRLIKYTITQICTSLNIFSGLLEADNITYL